MHHNFGVIIICCVSLYKW